MIGRESFTAVVLTTALQISAAPVPDEIPIIAEERCIPVHEQLKKMGATLFSEKLDQRGMDFKYGQFTIFAPNDELLENEGLVLSSANYTQETIDDVLLFHVSGEGIKGDIKDHCDVTLPMLNEELHVNQESSVTQCDGTILYQVGPGNAELEPKPKISSDATQACNGVIYAIENALMLPTLPDTAIPVSSAPNFRPTPKPAVTQTVTLEPAIQPTMAPLPIEAPTSAGNRLLSSSEVLVMTVTILVPSFF